LTESANPGLMKLVERYRPRSLIEGCRINAGLVVTVMARIEAGVENFQ